MKTGGMSIYDLKDELARREGVAKMKRYGEVEERAAAGIELVYQNSSTPWRRHAADQLQQVIKSKTDFTSDDIIQPLEARGIFTHDNRAIAAILRSAARAGLIEATDQWRETKHLKSHGRPKRVWRVIRRQS